MSRIRFNTETQQPERESASKVILAAGILIILAGIWYAVVKSNEPTVMAQNPPVFQPSVYGERGPAK